MNERRVEWLERKTKFGLDGVCLFEALVNGRRCGPYLAEQIVPMALALGAVAIAPAGNWRGRRSPATREALNAIGIDSDLVIEIETTPASGPVLAWQEWRGLWAERLFRILVFDEGFPISPAKLCGLQARIESWIR